MRTSAPHQPESTLPDAHHRVAVIGGGQAGLATSAELSRRGVDHVVLDGAPETGHSWRTRWDSLRLFTPAAYSSLPGMPFPGPKWHHPTKDEVADYLQAYAEVFELPVRHRSAVQRVTRPGGHFSLDTTTGVVTADEVVVATGPFQSPTVPGLSRSLAPEVVQLHSTGYRNASQLPTGATVLVVGAGNSGVQIAAELARTHRVHLAVGHENRHVRNRILGRDLFRWLTRAGMLTATPESRRGRRMQTMELVIGTSHREPDRVGVVRRPRVDGADGRRIRFEDGTGLDVDAVVWATGFRADHRLIEVPGAIDETGRVRQDGGVGAVDGLYTVGQPWQTNRGSALLGFVGADASLIAQRIAASRPTAPRQAALAR
jgi:putative flavoprotein involved in K+ transport